MKYLGNLYNIIDDGENYSDVTYSVSFNPSIGKSSIKSVGLGENSEASIEYNEVDNSIDFIIN